jgi:hypothetical protein
MKKSSRKQSTNNFPPLASDSPLNPVPLTSLVLLLSGQEQPEGERALTRLRRAGVVEKIGGVYQRIHKTLEQVAEECGTAGIGKKQRRQHQHERERFRKAVENGELQPGHGKKRLHVQPTSQPPAPNWDDLSGDAEAVEMEPLKVAASFKRRRKRSEEQTLCEEVAR